MNALARTPCALLLVLAVAASLPGQEVKRTYEIRANDRVVGHHVETETPVEKEGRPALRFEVRSFAKVEILGVKIDQAIDQTWILDPESRAVRRVASRLTAGEMDVAVEGKLGAAGFEAREKGGAVTTLDPAEVVISPDFRWLGARGPKEPGQTVRVRYFMPEMGGVHEATVALAGTPERELEVMGAKVPVRVYEIAVPSMGIAFEISVERETCDVVRYDMPAQGIVMERAPEAVVERLERVDLTSGILVKTNLDLEDPSVLTFMKVKARIEATPDVTAESLNVPGQRFEGKVEEGRIDGVFEIRPPRPDGKGAPPFPVPEGTFAAEALKPYLLPEEGIESDDPALAAQARTLAAGATSTFEVLERLARWTHEEIGYAIPGGVTARKTFEIRSGECGGHSRVLAAMLRALGIPARTPMGGMYVPLYGGSFGQHMWTEVWLGEAIGWLPVDCTAGQLTFVDAGHIRLKDGVTSFHPQAIEVLDHEPKAAAKAAPPLARRTDAYPYTAGETLVYVYRLAGNEIGKERLTYRGKEEAGHVFEGALSLAGGSFEETTRTVVGDDGRLVRFRCERKAGEDASTIEVTVDGTKATVATKSAEGDRTDAVDVDPAVFPLHNNCTAHFAIVLARLPPLAAGAEAKVRLLHDEQRSVFPMTLRAKAEEEITAGGKARRARPFEVTLVGLAITLHADADGRLLRFHQQQGDVTIELGDR